MPHQPKEHREYIDSPEYLAKKAAFARMTTIYGRQAVHEALLNHPHPKVVTLLLAEELSPKVTVDILHIAAKHGIQVKRMPREKLSRITKHREEDQGMAADLDFQLVKPFAQWLDEAPAQARLLAVIGVTTPANIGIIARSVAGAGLQGMVLPKQGCPEPTLPLVVKASAGHIFRTQLLGVEDAIELIHLAKAAGFSLFAMTSGPGSASFFAHRPPERAIYLLGNESIGLQPELIEACDGALGIPLQNGVDSLNVAAAATLVAFHVAEKP